MYGTGRRREADLRRGEARGVTWRLAGIAAPAAVLLFQIWAIRAQSLTVDEPYHLLAGHQALRYGVNTLNLEHPPLVKMLAALPFLATPPLAPPARVEEALELAQESVFATPATTRRSQLGARYVLLVAFVLPWLVGCYLLGRRLGGDCAGSVLALAMGLSFTTIPYLAIVQTDTAVALGFVATLLTAGRHLHKPTLATAAVMGSSWGLAMAAKFSGILAAPAVLGAAFWAPSRRRARQLAVAALLAVAVVALTYAVANRSYDEDQGRETIRLYAENRATLIVGDALRPQEPTLLALERLSPGLAQWLTGLLGVRTQSSLGVYASYAFGSLESRGRWWYFPVVSLVKMPLVILLASGCAVVAFLRERRDALRTAVPDPARRAHRRWLLVSLLTTALYLVVAMSSSYDLGVRYLLPVLPVLCAPAALWASRRRWRAAAFAGCLLVESLALGPLWLSATNTWWLGPRNPTRFALADDNLDWRQNLGILAREARQRGLDPLYLLDPTISAEAKSVYLPAANRALPGRPLQPGWYAVGIVVEQKIPAILRASPDQLYNYDAYRDIAESWEPLWQAVRTGEDRGYVAGTYHLYRLEAPP